MLPGSSVFLNSQVSIACGASMESAYRQTLARGGTAHSVFRLSYWLVALVLGLVSSSAAHAAPAVVEGRSEIDALGWVNPEVDKTPKSYPSYFPGLTSEGQDEFQAEQPSLNSGSESAARVPEVSPLHEDLVIDATELGLEISEVSGSEQSVSPALPTGSTGSELELGFLGSAPLEGALGLEPTALSLGDETATDPSFGAVFTQADLIAQGASSADEMPWRFSVEPFFYVPFGANGDVTVRGINAPINAGIGDIFSAIVNDLNFAAFGRVEAWKGPWGIFFNGAYMNLGTGRTANIPVPPVLQQIGLPPQASVAAATGTSFVQLDLGGAYRFGDGNLPMALRTADTEFDLGPFIFDALAGVRLYNFNNNLVLTGPMGNQFEFDQSKTVLEPMIGGRARWNLSHNLAALAGGSMSGFSIGDLTFSVAGYAGIDWLFSGNTSLVASYGFTYLDYSSGNAGLNLFTHGPKIGVKFRF
jgi:hypothetical protein